MPNTPSLDDDKQIDPLVVIPPDELNNPELWPQERKDGVRAIARVLWGQDAHSGGRPVFKHYKFGALIEQEFPTGADLLGSAFLSRGGAMVIAGVQKVAKSFLAIQAALSSMTNQPFLDTLPLGDDPNVPVPVSALMLQGELSDRALKDRIGQTVKHYNDRTVEHLKNRAMEMDVVFTHHHIKLDEPRALVWLADLLWSYGTDPQLDDEGKPMHGKPFRAPDIVIFDPFAWFHGLDENSTQDMAKVCGVLDRMRHGLGIAVVIVHHASKGAIHTRNTGHKMRGSSVLAGWYETLIDVSWKGGKPGGPREISFELRNGPSPDPIVAIFNPLTKMLEPLSAVEWPVELLVLQGLNKADETAPGQGMTVNEIHAMLNTICPSYANAGLTDTKLLESQYLARLAKPLKDGVDPEIKVDARKTPGKSGRPPNAYFITAAGHARLKALMDDENKLNAAIVQAAVAIDSAENE